MIRLFVMVMLGGRDRRGEAMLLATPLSVGRGSERERQVARAGKQPVRLNECKEAVWYAREY